MPYVPGGGWEDRPRVGCDRCVSTCWDGPVGPHVKSCGCSCTLDGCEHAAPWAVQLHLTEMQGILREKHGIVVTPRTRTHFRRIARWWELEAMRGYPSSDSSRQYAAMYRWLVELMDAGRRVTADAHGVYIDGELASAVQARTARAEQRKQTVRTAKTP